MQKRKRGETTNLLQWVRDAKCELHDSDMLLDIDDKHMDVWDVTFKLDMFASSVSGLGFEVLGDDGWICISQDVNEHLYKLINGSTRTICYQIGSSMYEASVKAGDLVQKNLSTDVERPIRKSSNTLLYTDIMEWFQKYGGGRIPGVHLKLKFPPNFPKSPPFVRVVFPRFMQWTGHVTIGGSMCTETLTMTGWDSKMTPIALLLHLQQNIIEGNGRINISAPFDYTEREAEEAYKRVANDHGWKI